jgi:L-cysteate sulfo-lyase
MLTKDEPRDPMSTDARSPGHGLTARFARVRLCALPTPLEAMKRLAQHLGGPNLFVKRDDCTSLAMGGNKVRQMEFVIGDVLDKGADTVISSAAVQSNHLRVLAGAAARLGLACEIVREDRVRDTPEDYYVSGNALLQALFGAKIHVRKGSDDDAAADRYLQKIAMRVGREGRKPYVIAGGLEFPALGALGYVEAAAEMLGQFSESGLHVDAIVVPSGSAQTHAGTLAGLRGLGSPIRVMGICVRRDQLQQAKRVLMRAQETAALIGVPDAVSEEDVWVTDKYLGPGYGIPSDETIAAIKLAASLEGLLVDPVYSGKAMAGLIGLARSGSLGRGSTIVFLHTGGTPALFAYRSRLAISESVVE